jgi:polar amino acid transport system substrate-binding protein
VWLVVFFLVAAVLLASLLLLRRELSEAKDLTWIRIQETGQILVCTDPSWPPFEFIDESSQQPAGFDVDLAHLVAPRLSPGTAARIVTVGFDSLYDALLAGRCDIVLSALPYEPMRTQDVVYSVAYFNAGLVLVTHEQTTSINKLSDLDGKVVGVEWGFVPQGNSQRKLFFEGLGMRRYDTAEGTLRALQSGEIQVAIVDRVAALAFLRDCENLRIEGDPITDVNYVIPVRPDSFLLLEEINRVLLEMREDGTLRALQDKWF